VNRHLPRAGYSSVPVAALCVVLAATLWLIMGAGSVLAVPDAPGQATATAIPTSLPPVDTPTPGLPATPVPTVIPPLPTATPPAVGNVCPQILRRVPRQAIDAAVANPRSVRGYNQPRDAGKPLGPYNPPRLWLSIMAYSKPYHPFFNSLEYKVGCP
jgi:hypothetical protein